jgi:transposase
MASIVEVKVGNHTYLYESVSKRLGKTVTNERRCVGKIDPNTKERHFKADYIEEMRTKGTPVKVASSQKVFSADDIRASAVLEAGLTHLLTESAEHIGLLPALRDALPGMWPEVFALTCFLVANNEAVMHASDWVEKVDMLPCGSLDSRRISELLAAVDIPERNRFYELWCKARSEAEYLALDITSTSSYSELIEDVEWGYNRDGEHLPQINICMLMGITSRLPIYQTVYAGSIRDVSTLDSVTSAFCLITHDAPVTTVTDKGFYSKRNIKAMLAQPERRFLAAVPFTSAFAKDQADGERKDIDCAANTIVVGSDSMRAVTKKRAFEGHQIFTHIFYSAKKAQGQREDVLATVAVLKDEAVAKPEKCSKSGAHTKFLNIRRSKKAEEGWTISIREDAVEAALGYTGWLVIISNCVDNAKEAITIYRAKDVVEKGFLHLKDDMDLGRLRVYGQERMQSKIFVGFLALILLSHIHSVMLDNNLYKKMTAKQLMRALSKQRVQVIDGQRIMSPASKTQKKIYAAFGVTPPV